MSTKSKHKERNNFSNVGNTPGNIVNGGHVAIQGNWVYYSGHSRGETRKVHINGSGDIEISKNNARYKNILGDWIYYSNNNMGRKIYKVRTDGSERTLISNDWSEFLCAINNWIYYVNVSDDCKVYKIRTDGCERTKLNDDRCSFLNVSNNWIYYVKNDNEYNFTNRYSNNNPPNGKIYKMHINGNTHTCLSDEEAGYINVINNYIYYSNISEGGKIYKIQTDGYGKEKITDHEAKYLNVVDDWIYYYSFGPKEGICKIRTDGCEYCIIDYKFIKYINIVGDWIYGMDGEDDYCRLHTSGKYYALMRDEHRSALHLRVKFENGKSYIYRTLDHNIKIGSKVKVEGKMCDLIGEVIDGKVKFNKDQDAYYISEVISYGSGSIDELSDKAKEAATQAKKKKSNRTILLEVKKANHRTTYCKTNDLDIVTGSVVIFQTTWEHGKWQEGIGVVVKRNVKGVSASDACLVIGKYPEGTTLMNAVNERKAKETKLKENYKSDLVKVKFDDNRSYSYKNVDPKLKIGSTVRVFRGGKVWEGEVVELNVEPSPYIDYLSILKVISYS